MNLKWLSIIHVFCWSFCGWLDCLCQVDILLNFAAWGHAQMSIHFYRPRRSWDAPDIAEDKKKVAHPDFVYFTNHYTPTTNMGTWKSTAWEQEKHLQTNNLVSMWGFGESRSHAPCFHEKNSKVSPSMFGHQDFHVGHGDLMLRWILNHLPDPQGKKTYQPFPPTSMPYKMVPKNKQLVGERIGIIS